MRQIDAIVIHHAGAFPGVDAITAAHEIGRWHRERGFSEIGYHAVEKDGDVVPGRRLDKVGAHCKGFNKRTVGFCFAYDARVRPHLPTDSINAFRSWYEDCVREDYFSMGTPVVPHSLLGRTFCPGSYAQQLNIQL